MSYSTQKKVKKQVEDLEWKVEEAKTFITKLRSTFLIQDQRALPPFSIICAYEHQRDLLFELVGVSSGQELIVDDFDKM